MKLTRLYLAVIILHLVLFSLVYILVPESRASFTEEDKFLENLTAIYYFESFWLNLFFWLLSTAGYKKIYMAISLIALACFLSELSFGERIFNLKMPSVLGYQIDALHDFIDLGYEILFYRLMPKIRRMSINLKVLMMVFVLGVAIFIILKLWKHRKYFISRSLALTKSQPAFLFLPFFIVSFIASLAVDLNILGEKQHFFLFLEEFCEMNAALILLFASFAIRDQNYKINSQG